MIKAWFFDIDGTIFDSLSGHDEAFDFACDEYGIDVTDAFKKKKLSKVSSHKLDILAKEGLIDKMSIPWILERKNEISMDTCFKNFVPSQEHIDVMNFIDKKLQCRIALCSNSPRPFVNKYVNMCGFKNILSFSLSGDDVERKKPSPDIYEKALNLLNLDSDECIVFEDSEEGIHSAEHANIHNIVKIKDPKEIDLKLIKKLVKEYKI